MAVPKFEKLMKPTLEILSDGEVHNIKDVENTLIEKFNLTEEDLSELLASGGAKTRFKSNANWARTYMKQAGLLVSPEPGNYQITETGKEALLDNPPEINIKYLNRFPAFIDFKNRKRKKNSTNDKTYSEESNPEDVADEAISQINNSLAEDLLDEIMKIDHTRFEQMAVDLLVKMGYGRPDDSYATVASGDGGIDGILYEDKLGFSKILIQAKHWERDRVVGRPELQQFKGAITGKTDKGVFITTGKFSNEAREYAKESHIILIDGERLAEIMIEYNFCVSPRKTYEIKTLDTDLLSDYQS